MKILATAGPRGLALTEIAARAAMPHPSVHRILRQLGEERLVSRNADLKRYRLGPLAYELGIAVTTLYGDLRDLCAVAMEKLSIETGDTSYLIVRSGFDAVCMHRQEGEFPVRAMVLDVGGRRPLGVGAAALALLAALEEEERRLVIDRIGPKLGSFGSMTVADLERACTETVKTGTAVVHDTLSWGVSAIGRAFRDALGHPVGALAVAALSHRMSKERIKRLAPLLEDACVEVQRHMRRSQLQGWTTGA